LSDLTKTSRLRLRNIFLFSVILGPLCFVVNNLAVWSAMLRPPAGYIPRFVLSNLDVPIYLTWMTLAPTHWLLPNFDAPWASDDALLSPLVLTVGKLSHLLGLSPVAGFQAFHFLFYIVAAFALGAVIWTFCRTGRQRFAAAAAIFAALPLPLLALGWMHLAGREVPLFWIGLVEYAYETADGLTRGGVSNTFTLSFGTAANLFALCLLARFVRDRRSRDLTLLAMVAFLAGFFHPTEVCVITGASLASFAILAWRERRLVVLVRNGAVVGGAAALGLLPYVVQTSRSEWVRDISRLYQWQPPSVLWVPLVFGLPTVLVVYLLLMRFRLQAPGDEVLRTWFLSTIALLFVPGIPFKLHMFDGFPYVVAVLLVRLLAGRFQVRALLRDHPRPACALTAAGLLLCLPGYGTLYRQIWNDGRAAQPELLLNAVSKREEPALIDWLRHNAQLNQLIMGPLETAPWLATTPMPSVASHDLFGITYDQQAKFVADFYAGKLSDAEAENSLARYGVHYLVAPNGSPGRRYLSNRKELGSTGPWTIYELPKGHRPPYPGLATLRPDVVKQFDFGGLMAAAHKAFGR